MKASRVTVEGVVEAVRNFKDLDERTSTNRKNRACEPGRFAVDPLDVCDAENCQKGKSVSGSWDLSEKEEKRLKVAELCGAELPNPDRSMNYSSDIFSSCGIGWCREHCGFLKETVKRIPAAELEFGELYAEQKIEMKVGRAEV